MRARIILIKWLFLTVDLCYDIGRDTSYDVITFENGPLPLEKSIDH